MCTEFNKTISADIDAEIDYFLSLNQKKLIHQIFALNKKGHLLNKDTDIIENTSIRRKKGETEYDDKFKAPTKDLNKLWSLQKMKKEQKGRVHKLFKFSLAQKTSSKPSLKVQNVNKLRKPFMQLPNNDLTLEKAQMKTYCFCNGVDDGSLMIACERPSCSIEWFHFRCVGIQGTATLPKKWYCKPCLIFIVAS